MTAAASDRTGYVGHPELPDGYYPYLGPRPDERDDWLADAALATAVIGLFPAAIVLGHRSVIAAREGRARERSRALVALGIGYISATIAVGAALAVVAVGLGDPAALATLTP